MALRTVSQKLKEILAIRDRQLISTLERRGVIKGSVLGRNSDGTVQVQSESAECVLRSSIDTEPDDNLIGVSGFPFGSTSTLFLAWVERLDPNVLVANQTQVVTVIGRGLVQGVVYTFLLPDFTPHPLVTIDSENVIDSTTVELTVTVGDAEPLIEAPLRYSYS